MADFERAYAQLAAPSAGYATDFVAVNPPQPTSTSSKTDDKSRLASSVTS